MDNSATYKKRFLKKKLAGLQKKVEKCYLCRDDTEMAKLLGYDAEEFISAMLEQIEIGEIAEIVAMHEDMEKSFSDYPRLLDHMPFWYVRYHNDMAAFVAENSALFDIYDAEFVSHGLMRVDIKDIPLLENYYTPYTDAIWACVFGGQTRKEYASMHVALVLDGFDGYIVNMEVAYPALAVSPIFRIFCSVGGEVSATVFGMDARIAISLLLAVCLCVGLALCTGAEKRARSEFAWLYAVLGALTVLFATATVGLCFLEWCCKRSFLHVEFRAFPCILTVGCSAMLAVCLAIAKLAHVLSRKHNKTESEESGAFRFAWGIVATAARLCLRLLRR